MKLYKQEVSKYTKKDAITALCVWLAMCIIVFVFGTIMRTVYLGGMQQTVNLVQQFAFMLLCVVVVLLKKQGLSSIGFRTDNIWSALRLGLVISIVPLLLYNGLLAGIINEWQLQPIRNILYGLLITFLFAAPEDIAFTGYIQPRLHGLVKIDALAVFVGALLFAFLHIVFFIAVIGLSEFSLILSPHMVGWIGSHIMFNLIFRKYFSIYPVIIFHTFFNFAAAGRLWLGAEHGIDETISFVILISAVIVWACFSYYSSKKISKQQTT